MSEEPNPPGCGWTCECGFSTQLASEARLHEQSCPYLANLRRPAPVVHASVQHDPNSFDSEYFGPVTLLCGCGYEARGVDGSQVLQRIFDRHVCTKPAPSPSRCTTCSACITSDDIRKGYRHTADGLTCNRCVAAELRAGAAREREANLVASALRHKPTDWGKP